MSGLDFDLRYAPVEYYSRHPRPRMEETATPNRVICYRYNDESKETWMKETARAQHLLQAQIQSRWSQHIPVPDDDEDM